MAERLSGAGDIGIRHIEVFSSLFAFSRGDSNAWLELWLAGPPAGLRDQTIHPYTDLLLHDMGPGLASSLGEGDATGAEWRTAPLWGIGLTAVVSGGEACLHDGRARNLTQAILWHGGEAESAKQAFAAMSQADKDAVIAFLMSL